MTAGRLSLLGSGVSADDAPDPNGAGPATWVGHPIHWHPDALCRKARHPRPLDLFFPPVGGTSKPAKAYCARCPVRGECLETALAVPHAHDAGVFGGTTVRERRLIRRARRVESDNAAQAA